MSKRAITEQDYKDLICVVLARIIVFNAKRGGEAGRMLVSSFHSPLKIDRNDFGLSELEKRLTTRYENGINI